MMKHRPVVAIDLGSTKVACVVGTPLAHHPGFEILGVGLANYPLPLSTWPCEPSLLARTIEQALEETGVRQPLQRAAVALSHPELLHTQVTAQIDLANEPVTIHSRHLSRLYACALSQAVGIDWDPLLVEPLGYSGNGFEGVRDPHTLLTTRLKGTFHLIGIPLSLRWAVTQALEAVGLEMEQLAYSLQAIAASCLPAPPIGGAQAEMLPQRVLLVDIGGCCTDLAILDDGCFTRTATIPWGGMTLASAIAHACHVTWREGIALSLEGPASPKPKVRQLVGKQLMILQRSLHQLLKGETLPDLAIVTGRGALIDGLVEWVETMSEINARLGRSPRAATLGDLSRQVALSPALGLFELTFRTSGRPSARGGVGQSPQRFPRPSARVVDRLLDRTKQILVEYF